MMRKQGIYTLFETLSLRDRYECFTLHLLERIEQKPRPRVLFNFVKTDSLWGLFR